MKKVNKYVITDERLYYYFHRSDSILHRESNKEEKIVDTSNLLEMYDERLKLFKEDKFQDVYNTCLLNMMNMTITFFLDMTDKKIKKSLLKRYRLYFNEFNKGVLRNLPLKDKVRFLTFRIDPGMYMLLLLSLKIKATR